MEKLGQLHPLGTNFYVLFEENLVLLGSPLHHPAIVLLCFFVFALVGAQTDPILAENFLIVTAPCATTLLTMGSRDGIDLHQRHVIHFFGNSGGVGAFLTCNHRNIYELKLYFYIS